jgi:hypothetical protein
LAEPSADCVGTSLRKGRLVKAVLLFVGLPRRKKTRAFPTMTDREKGAFIG